MTNFCCSRVKTAFRVILRFKLLRARNCFCCSTLPPSRKVKSHYGAIAPYPTTECLRGKNTKIIFCASANRALRKAPSICRMAYGKRVNFCPFYNREPLKGQKEGEIADRRDAPCGGVTLISRHFAAGSPARNARTLIIYSRFRKSHFSEKAPYLRAKRLWRKR